jgi:hypothetical protein
MKQLVARAFHGTKTEQKTRTLTLFRAPRRRKPKVPEVLYERPYAQRSR